MSAPVCLEFYVEANDYMVAGTASNNIKEALKMIGIPSDICRRAAVITYEAEMNLVIHGGGGAVLANISSDQIEIQTVDEGPGIADISLAIEEGYTTASDQAREMGFGAGMGLPNIKRNADEFELESQVGKGTRLRTVLKFPKKSG